MSVNLEDQLSALFESSRSRPRASPAILRRLQFVARLLREAPPGERTGLTLLWLDERGAAQSVEVGPTGLVLGRDTECDVVLAGPRVSRRHCAVRLGQAAAEEAEIEDLGSRNGTLVNGASLGAGAQPLKEGDVVEVGGVALAVVAGSGSVHGRR